MKKLITLLIIMSLSTLAGSFVSLAQAEVPAFLLKRQNSIAPMLQRVVPAIVNITVQGEIKTSSNPFRKNNNTQPPSKKQKGGKFLSIGSGVIINAKKGYIVTNAHVIYNAKNILITLKDGRHLTAKLIGADTQHDVALLKISAKNLTQLPLANSDNLQVGDFVAAVGSPYGLNQTVTSGIVSAMNRSDLGIEGFENFIQTDAPINPGNSGGALVDLKGKLVGINTAIIAPSRGNVGIGFAIPSNTVQRVVDQLEKYGKIKRGMLGVQIQTLTPNLASALHMHNQKGAIVTQVVPYSPAAKAGLKAGDIIIKINNEAVSNSARIRNIVGLMLVNEKIHLKIIRNRKKLSLNATITSLPYNKIVLRKANPYLFGVTTSNITIRNPAVGTIKGVQVMQVSYNSPAFIAGLRPGDIIISANNSPTDNISSLEKIIHSIKISHSNISGYGDTKKLLLHILRGGSGSFFIVIQ